MTTVGYVNYYSPDFTNRVVNQIWYINNIPFAVRTTEEFTSIKLQRDLLDKKSTIHERIINTYYLLVRPKGLKY